MNILGPVSETPEGYKFIFTAMDFYSKWVEAFPICNKYPAEVAACLKLIFYRHGAWKSVLSSETLEFVEAVSRVLPSLAKCFKNIAPSLTLLVLSNSAIILEVCNCIR